MKKIKIKSAMRFASTKPAINFNHVSSTSFFRPGIAHFYEMVPNQKVKLDLQQMLRFDPLIKPFLGSCQLRFHTFFVPYRTVDPAAVDYFADSLHTWSDGSNASVVATDRTVDMGTFQALFFDTSFGLTTGANSIADGVQFDFQCSNGDFDYIYYTLTPKGKQFLKILNQLGYQISPVASDASVLRSLYPLLSWLRVYHDWFYPEQYTYNGSYVLASNFLNANSPSTRNLYSPTPIYSTTSAHVLFQIIDSTLTLAYGDDYFMTSFDNPSGPNNGAYGDFTMFAPPFDGSNGEIKNINGDSYNTPYYENPNGTFTQYGLNLLKSLSNFLKRNQLAGSGAIDRFLARFGFTNTPEKFNRSVLVGKQYIDIPIGDVMAHADSIGASLGDYAGQGACNSNNISFEFENKSVDYGMLLVVYSVVPQSRFAFGERRDVLRLSKLDHWTPEFDARSVEAIPKSMVLVSPAALHPFGLIANTPYAFTNIYSSYKFGFDSISGLFRPRLVINNKDVVTSDIYKNWHLERIVPYESLSVEHNVNSVRSYDRGQYNRVFYNTNEDADDNMFIIVRTSQVNTDNMYNAFDDYSLIHSDDGKDVEIAPLGNQLS